MPREEFACAHRLRVRWAEVDMQRIVFNGHYLTYLDTAVAEYWRAIGLPYPEGMTAAPLPEKVRERVCGSEKTAPAQ